MPAAPIGRGSAPDGEMRGPASSATSVMENAAADLAAAAAPSLFSPHAPAEAAPGPTPAPPEAAGEDEWSDSQQDDGPTMAIASPVVATPRPLRDDMANPRRSPMASTAYVGPNSSTIDRDAETMALAGEDPRLPPPGYEGDENTRAVSREEMMRHQDAHVVVGEDAMGDEATLAVAPGTLDGFLGEGGIAAALKETLQKREDSQPQLPAFPPPPQHFQQNMPPPGQGSSGHLQAAPQHGQHPGGMGMPQHSPSWSGDAAQSYQNPQQHPGMPQGFDPMYQQQQQGMGPPSSMQGQMQGGYPQSGPHGVVPQSHPMGNANAPGQFGHGGQAGPAGYQQPMQQHGGQGGAPLPWMTQQSPPPAGMSAPSKFTPQVILLIAVGAVCLAIFVIGIVLFVTTKF